MNSKALPGNFVSGIGRALPPAMWWWMKTLWLAWKTSKWEKRKQSLNRSAQNNTSKIAMFDITQLRNTFFYFYKGITAILLLSGFMGTEGKQSENTSGGAVLAQVFSTWETGWVPDKAQPTEGAQRTRWGPGDCFQWPHTNDSQDLPGQFKARERWKSLKDFEKLLNYWKTFIFFMLFSLLVTWSRAVAWWSEPWACVVSRGSFAEISAHYSPYFYHMQLGGRKSHTCLASSWNQHLIL